LVCSVSGVAIASLRDSRCDVGHLSLYIFVHSANAQLACWSHYLTRFAVAVGLACQGGLFAP
jgi:hypothetical protein